MEIHGKGKSGKSDFLIELPIELPIVLPIVSAYKHCFVAHIVKKINFLNFLNF